MAGQTQKTSFVYSTIYVYNTKLISNAAKTASSVSQTSETTVINL